MHRERVSENVFWFQSEIYAQVTAGVVAGPQWAVVIDTLALPEETIAIREFVERELNLQVRYVINTHYHADHAGSLAKLKDATEAMVYMHALDADCVRRGDVHHTMAPTPGHRRPDRNGTPAAARSRE